MDLTVRIDPSNTKWSGGSIEEIALTLTRTDGELDEANVTVGIGDYSVAPTTWFTPTTTWQESFNVVRATLLIGSTIQPTGQVWAWARAHAGVENPVNRCATNARLDFTNAGWSGGGGGGGDLVVVDNGDGTFTMSGSNVGDNGDGSWTTTDPGATDLGATFQLVA